LSLVKKKKIVVVFSIILIITYSVLRWFIFKFTSFVALLACVIREKFYVALQQGNMFLRT